MTLRDDHHATRERNRDEPCPTIGQEAQERLHIGRGRRHRPRTEREIPLRSYEALHGDRAVNDLLLRRVLYGISCRNDAAAAEAIPGAIGLSGSTVSRAFIEASAAKLRELQERDLSREDVVALVLDGKDLRRVDDGRRAGHHDDGGDTLPGLCRDGHRKREGVDTVPPGTADGRTKREIIRCLKRFLAREIYQRVMTDVRARQELIQAA